MKRWICAVMAMCMILGLFCSCGKENPDFKMERNKETDNYCIVKYVGSDTEVQLPTTHKGKPVVSVDGAFAGNTTVTKVTIPEGYQFIGERSFSNCTALVEVEIPESVMYIWDWAFSGCTALKEIRIPGAAIGWYAFLGCTGLERVELGTVGDGAEGIYSIERGGFEDCTGLQEAYVGDRYKEIGWNAFCGCENLEALYVSRNVKEFGMNALLNCPKLTAIYYSGTEEMWNEIEFHEFWDGGSIPVYFNGI